MPHIIVGTAGHIDHGKTALVKALTGIDADRLKEEKERGITIDIGFASLPIDAETTLGFVDVPGHERFVKNMLAGIGGIDLVMLVVAADESVMPQTREHLDICSLLHIRHGLTVLTKIDAAEREIADLAEIEVHELLEGTFLERSPVLRVSAHTGEGLPELVAALRAMAHVAPEKDASRIFRLPVDRSFTMKGFGTVVSGTLVAGRVEREQEVEILPQGQTARVRGLQVHGAAVEQARAGQRTALNLQRVELGAIERGMVLAPPGVFKASTMFDVQLELLPSAPAAIVGRKRVRFHIGTAEIMAYAVLLGEDMLAPGGSAYAQIRLERPTFALPGDRFILRQYSPMTTLGGGEIIDARPKRHRRSDRAIAARLRRLHHASPRDRVLAVVIDAGLNGAAAADVVGQLGMLPQEAREHLAALVSEDRAAALNEQPLTVAAADTFAQARQAIVDAVTAFHEANPLLAGIGRDDLKGRVMKEAAPLVYRAAIESLVGERRLALEQDLVHLFGRSVTLGGEEARVRERLAARYRELGLQAPNPDEVIASLALDHQTARKILQLMLKDKSLVRINEEMTVDRDALRKLIDDLRALKAGGRFGVKEFKELTGVSRKFAVPLLEYLDGQRITRRVGDERIVL
ncbi:MAG: selenocysteine-specific translation elongation factor [Vicinamibacterales bacterium]